MKTEIVKQDFMIALSVLFLCALFNKTIIRILSDYETFTSEIESMDWKGYFTSKYFLLPNLYSLLTIVWFFVWLVSYALKK